MGANDSNQHGKWWWLETFAKETTFLGDGGMMVVYGAGKIETGGIQSISNQLGIRPVITLDLSKLQNNKR